jgi:hypothetical protein
VSKSNIVEKSEKNNFLILTAEKADLFLCQMRGLIEQTA